MPNTPRRGHGLIAVAAGLSLALAPPATSIAQDWMGALDTLDGLTSLMTMAFEADRYPDEVLVAEFGPFVSPKDASARAKTCRSAWIEAISSYGVLGGAEYAASEARGRYTKALEESLKARAAYRAELESWSGLSGTDAERLFDRQVKTKRDAWRAAESRAKFAVADLEARNAEAARLRKATGALFARLLDIPAPAGGTADVLALYKQAIERCHRLYLWEDRGAIKAAADRKAEAAAIKGATRSDALGTKGAPQTKSGSAVARPPADTANEGPPPDEPAPGPQTTRGGARTLAGMVDQRPALAANGKLTLQSGTITLTFLPEPGSEPPGGRVEITGSTTLTYIFDYKNPPSYDLQDREVSACALTGGRFLMAPDGEPYPGMVGGFNCNIETGRTGQPSTMSTASGGLRLDRIVDPSTGAQGWYLTFVTGPRNALWKLQ